jgi:hypothetical protein
VSRGLRLVALLVLMALFGTAVYFGLGRLTGARALRTAALTPDKSHTTFTLPGTILVVQNGTIYRLQGSSFKALTSGSWTQPSITPDGQHLIAVKQELNYSDLYELGLNGQIERQITNNASGTVQYNHWSFHPTVSPGGTLFYDYDQKYFLGSNQVDLWIYAMPLAGQQSQAQAWTTPNFSTGGDIQPLPLRSGGIIFSNYFGNQTTGYVWSQLWYTPSAGAPGHTLTPSTQNCASPALNPAQTMLAMVCLSSNGEQAQIVVAPLEGNQLGPQTVVATGMVNSPTWSPDGKDLLYLEGTGANGYFQLYYQQVMAEPPAPTPSSSAHRGRSTPTPSPTPTPALIVPPSKPRPLTTDDNFQATSAPLWYS